MLRTVLVALPVLVLAVPMALAESVAGTTFTGDVDVYNVPPPDQICAQVISDWRVTLVLRPGPGPDIVKLSAQGTTADVDVTTPNDRTAEVFVTTSTACPPIVTVTGVLVASAGPVSTGELGYNVSWERANGGGVPI